MANKEHVPRKKSVNPSIQGLCDACPKAPACEDVTTLRGQASCKPQGRKPRPRCGHGKAKTAMGICRFAVGRDGTIRLAQCRCHCADAQRRRCEAGLLDDAAEQKRRYGSVR